METRLSLAGAQSKVAWFLPKEKDVREAELGDWLIPRGTAPSSHIIKISKTGERDLASNEAACALLAQACGFDAAQVQMLSEIPGAIAVRRYDRKWVGGADGKGKDARLMRLHQEDFCQALGLLPLYKYQPFGVRADYIMTMADLISETVENPAADRREFARRLVFGYLIGNADAHLKNYSLLYDPAWKKRALAPMYDLTCIPLSGYSTNMPFDFGEHRALEDIDSKDILAVALDMDVNISDFAEDVSELINLFETPCICETDGNIRDMLDRILDNAAPRIRTVKEFLG